MTKNKQILLFSAIGVIVLAAVTAVLLLTAPKPETEPIQDLTADEESSKLILSDKTANDVAKLTITNESGTYEITADGDGFTIAEFGSAPLSTGTLKNMAGYAAAFEAKDFVEEVASAADLAKYGLDGSAASVKADFTDGTAFSFKVGKEVPSMSNSMYITADDKTVYTCYKTRVGGFTDDKFSLIDCTAVPEVDNSSEEVKKLTVERVDFDEPLMIENIVPDEENAIQVYTYRLTSPYTAYADLTDAPNFMYSLFGLKAKKAVWVGMTELDYETAGLNNPNCKITVETDKNTYTLTLGSALVENVTDENGEEKEVVSGFYGVSSEVPDVLYLFNYEDITAARINPERLISKLFLMPYIYSLDGVDYSDSEGRDFSITFKTVKGAETVNENGETVTAEDTHYHYLNGEEYDEQRIKNLYQYFISAAGEELYFDEDKGDLLATITYNYTDKSSGFGGRDIVRFYSSNTDRKVIINLNGENIFKTRQMYLTQLLTNAENFLSGGEIVLTY